MPRASPGRNRAGRPEPMRPCRARGPCDEAGRWRSAPCPAKDAARSTRRGPRQPAGPALRIPTSSSFFARTPGHSGRRARANDPLYTGLNDNPRFNCSLPNEQLRGWTRPGGADAYGNDTPYLAIETHEGSATSVVATSRAFDTSGHDFEPRNPPTYRVCISEAREDGRFPLPFLCDTVSYGTSLSVSAEPQDEAVGEGD